MAWPQLRGIAPPFAQLQEQIRRNMGIYPTPDFRTSTEETTPETAHEDAVYFRHDPNFVGPLQDTPQESIADRTAHHGSEIATGQFWKNRAQETSDDLYANAPDYARNIASLAGGSNLGASLLGGTAAALTRGGQNIYENIRGITPPHGMRDTASDMVRAFDPKNTFLGAVTPGHVNGNVAEAGVGRNIFRKMQGEGQFQGDRTTGAPGVNFFTGKKQGLAELSDVAPVSNRYSNNVSDTRFGELQQKFGGRQELPPVEEPQRAKADDGGVKIGADVRSLGKVLGSSLYQGDIGKIATKELLQNSIDAIDHLGGEGNIKVNFGHNELGKKFVEVGDNGKGLTKNELQTVFTDLGSSGKREDENAVGGFGLAKAAPLLGGESVDVQSVAREADGNLYRHSFTGTPDDLLNGVNIKSIKIPEGTPTGMTVRTYIPKDSEFYNSEGMVNDIVRNSPKIKGKIEMRTQRQPKYSIPDYETLNNMDINGASISSASNPYADFDIIIPKSAKYGENTPRYDFLNNGMWQGRAYADYNNHPGIPDKILVNIKSKVPEGHAEYPFTANREELRGATRDEVLQHIKNFVIQPAHGKRVNELNEVYNNMPSVELPELKGHKRGFFVYDVGGKFSPDELHQITKSPHVQKLATTISNTLNDAMNVAGHEQWDEKLQKIGFIFDESVHGIHIPAPGTGKSAILLNPFQSMSTSTPDEAAASIFHTVLHELGHVAGGGHDESFAGRLANIYSQYGFKKAYEAQLKILDSIADPANLSEYSPEIQDVLQRYTEARGRPPTKVDPLRGTGIGSKATKFGQRANVGNVEPIRKRTTPKLSNVIPVSEK